MKKLGVFLIVFALVLVLTLGGCSPKEKKQPTEQSQISQSDQFVTEHFTITGFT